MSGALATDGATEMALPPVDTFGSLLAVHSGQVLDVTGASLEDAAPLIQFPFHGGPNQRFRFEKTGEPGTFRIVAQHSNKVLDIAGASLNDGAQLVQFTPKDTVSQRFVLEQQKGELSDYFLIRSKHSGKPIGAAAGSVDGAARVVQLGEQDSRNRFLMLWKFVTKLTGTFDVFLDGIQFRHSPNNFIDLKGRVSINGVERVKAGVGFQERPFDRVLYSTADGTVHLGGPDDKRPLRLRPGDRLYVGAGESDITSSAATITQTLLGSDKWVMHQSGFGAIEQWTFDLVDGGRAIRLLFTVRRALQ
jgi:Ricin-type beta-trefoil lectin domain-like